MWQEIDRLREALDDIARGPLQSPDFYKYAIKKAKNALKGVTNTTKQEMPI